MKAILVQSVIILVLVAALVGLYLHKACPSASAMEQSIATTFGWDKAPKAIEPVDAATKIPEAPATEPVKVVGENPQAAPVAKHGFFWRLWHPRSWHIWSRHKTKTYTAPRAYKPCVAYQPYVVKPYKTCEAYRTYEVKPVTVYRPVWHYPVVAY